MWREVSYQALIVPSQNKSVIIESLFFRTARFQVYNNRDYMSKYVWMILVMWCLNKKRSLKCLKYAKRCRTCRISLKKLIKTVLVESEGLKVRTKHGTLTNGRVAYPVTWRDQPITAVSLLLFKLEDIIPKSGRKGWLFKTILCYAGGCIHLHSKSCGIFCLLAYYKCNTNNTIQSFITPLFI